MVPPQPYSGSPGCPPVTTTFNRAFVDGLLPNGSAAKVSPGSPAARVLPNKPPRLSMFRRVIFFICQPKRVREERRRRGCRQRGDRISLLPLRRKRIDGR